MMYLNLPNIREWVATVVERLITFIVSESLTEKKDFLDFGEK
jgi:hypothetical protein